MLKVDAVKRTFGVMSEGEESPPRSSCRQLMRCSPRASPGTPGASWRSSPRQPLQERVEEGAGDGNRDVAASGRSFFFGKGSGGSPSLLQGGGAAPFSSPWGRPRAVQRRAGVNSPFAQDEFPGQNGDVSGVSSAGAGGAAAAAGGGGERVALGRPSGGGDGDGGACAGGGAFRPKGGSGNALTFRAGAASDRLLSKSSVAAAGGSGSGSGAGGRRAAPGSAEGGSGKKRTLARLGTKRPFREEYSAAAMVLSPTGASDDMQQVAGAVAAVTVGSRRLLGATGAAVSAAMPSAKRRKSRMMEETDAPSPSQQQQHQHHQLRQKRSRNDADDLDDYESDNDVIQSDGQAARNRHHDNCGGGGAGSSSSSGRGLGRSLMRYIRKKGRANRQQQETVRRRAELLFTMEDVEQIVQRALDEQERELTRQHEHQLQNALQEQYNMFTKFNQDYISNQMKEREFSYCM